MPTKTGFKKHTAEEIYTLDGIFANDVIEIAELKGFQTPLSEEQRSQVKEFVKKAKEHNLTINQAIQLASKAQQAPPPVQQADPVNTVTDEFSAKSTQQQVNLMQEAINGAKQKIVINKVAENLAIAQLEATGWDLSDRPDLQAMLAQSTAIRQQVEAVNPVLLPFGQMVTIALGDIPTFAGKLPALPTTATRMLSAQDVNP